MAKKSGSAKRAQVVGKAAVQELKKQLRGELLTPRRYGL
jgi:hypothetical protein